jgi:hypothetical protein
VTYRLLSSLLLLPLAVANGQQGARRPAIEVWPERVVATFPPIPVDSLGCPDDYAPGSDSRRYFWQLAVVLPDSHYPNNHFMLAGVEVEAPRRTVMRHAVLDSLLGEGRYYADEAAGEPAMPIRDLEPQTNHVRWDPDHSQAVLTLEGRAAVETIFRTRPEKASLGWCTRSGYGNATMSVNYR